MRLVLNSLIFLLTFTCATAQELTFVNEGKIQALGQLLLSILQRSGLAAAKAGLQRATMEAGGGNGNN